MWKIAAGGIAIECATFAPLPSELSDFDVLRGGALRERYAFAERHRDVEFVPLLQAHAVPGGVLRRSVYAALKQEFLAGLAASAPWDGVYLDMHGAMAVAGLDDAEADFIRAVRAAVGPNCLISASYDLHGNLSAAVLEALDLITAYRTAPHEDAAETRVRAFQLLLHCLRAGRRPQKAFLPIPALLSGERTMTLVEPGKSVYAEVARVSAEEALLDASLLVGFTWADQARSQAAAVALAWDADAAQSAARRLAGAYWDARHAFGFAVPTGTVDACVSQALASTASTVFLSDSGDNVTAGAAGDVPFMLERLLAQGAPRTLYAGMADAAAVAACFRAGVGARLDLRLGGALDPVHGRPLPVTGLVQGLHERGRAGRQAILRVDRVDVILTERRLAFTTLAQFSDLGLDPLAYRIVCLKLGYLFPDFQRIAPEAIMAFSPGAVDARPETLPFHNIQRPMYPFDRDFDWSPDPKIL